MNRLIRVVAVGGGTGLSNLLRGLKNYPLSLSAVVTMADNGASSGRLSREMGTLPPGDVRKCLASLSDDEDLLTRLFEYRFKKGRGLSGHSLGNLLLLALSDITGNFEAAVQACSQILSIRGRVIPSTLSHVNIVAQLKNGQMALGEIDLPVLGHRFGIRKVFLLPEQAKANPLALHCLINADVILIGPGSLLTSIIPNFLISDLKSAVKKSKAAKYYICNVSTERGETEGFTVEDHLKTLMDYSGLGKLDGVLVNTRLLRQEQRSKTGRLGGIHNITTDKNSISGIKVIKTDLIDETDPLYHDQKKLGSSIWEQLICQPARSVSTKS